MTQLTSCPGPVPIAITEHDMNARTIRTVPRKDKIQPRSSLPSAPPQFTTSMQTTTLPSPNAKFSTQDRRERCNPSGPRHSLGCPQIAPQDLSDTLHTQKSGGDPEMGHFLALPGTIYSTKDPRIPSPIGPRIGIVPQPKEYQLERPYLPELSGSHEKRGPGGIHDTGSGPAPMGPPKHIHPLYHSIDLPDVGDKAPILLPPESRLSTPRYPPRTGGTHRWTPDATIPDPTFKTKSNTLGLFTDTLHLHPLIQHALSSPSFTVDLQDAADPGTEQLWDSATNFAVRRLWIVVPETSVTVDVEPSVRNGDIVRVGDVLQALKIKTAMGNSSAWKRAKAGVLIRGYY